MRKKETYISVLKSFGFEQEESSDPDIKVFFADNATRQATIYYETWGQWVWIVGKDIPNNSTISYPGGSSFYEVADLKNCLEEN